MLTPVNILRTLLDYIDIVVSFTNRSLSIGCLRNTNKTLKNSTSSASDTTINIKNYDVQFVTVSTSSICIERCLGTRSNIDPLYTRQILTLSILITDRRDCSSVVVGIINRIGCLKCNAIFVESNIQTTLNTTSSNIASVGALSYSLSISKNTNNTTSRKRDFQFLISRVPSKNIYCFVRTRNRDSCRSTRSEISNNNLLRYL